MESKSLIGFLEWLASKEGLDRVVFCLRVGSFVYFLYALRLFAVLYISFAYQKKKCIICDLHLQNLVSLNMKI